MKDFLLVFRSENAPQGEIPGANQDRMELWMKWLGGIAEQGKLVTAGNPLLPTGKVLKPGNMVTNGPYMEIKESIGGYSIVKAESYDEAVELSKGCPILEVGGNVEIRELIAM